MARDLRPECKRCRREGEKLFLKGEKCYTEKCPFERRGPATQRRRGRISTYGIQLRTKQKLKTIYGLLEHQLKKYFLEAQRKGDPTERLIPLIERRLDNVIYRAEIGVSRQQARQFVRHGHVYVNGRKVDIPSFLVSPGDEITISEKLKNLESVKSNFSALDTSTLPSWLSVDVNNFTIKILRLPESEDIKDIDIKTHYIVELYSK